MAQLRPFTLLNLLAMGIASRPIQPTTSALAYYIDRLKDLESIPR
jgi:hypothetical protein